MNHKGTQTLFKYWNEQRGHGPAPYRKQISPAAIAPVLSSTCILEKSDDEPGFRFRLAGTNICAIFCGELKGQKLSSLVAPDDRRILDRLSEAAHAEKVTVLVELDGRTAKGDFLGMELMILPLADETPRLLGSIQALETPYWVGARPLTEVNIQSVRIIDPDAELICLQNRPAVAIPAGNRNTNNSSWRSRFTVFDGGLSRNGTAGKPDLTIIPGGKQ